MFYRVFICIFSLLIFLAPSLSSQEKKTQEKKTEVLIIEQLSDGFPGADKKGGSLIPQRVYLHSGKLVIQDLVRPGILRIVRLDQKLI